MYLLALSKKLRVIAQAAKSLSVFLKLAEALDQDRSPLMHRLTEKDLLSCWTTDLVRLVGKFGSQLHEHPGLIFSLVPAFCPRNSVIHQQFRNTNRGSGLRVRGLSN